jgi:hypothetical protein
MVIIRFPWTSSEIRIQWMRLPLNVAWWSTREYMSNAKVAFSGQNEGMAEEELNLLQLASVHVTQLCAGSPQIVGRDIAIRRKLHIIDPLHVSGVAGCSELISIVPKLVLLRVSRRSEPSDCRLQPGIPLSG